MPRRIEQQHLATKDAEINAINDSTNHTKHLVRSLSRVLILITSDL